MSTKLLTIDDCKIIRQTVVNTLRKYDCTILEAGDGLAGLAVASRERPDVILLDYKMPVMDGSEALARLRADPELRNTPVIMLTAESGRESVLKIAKLGVRDYLLKPFQGGILIEKLRRLVPLRTKAESALPPKDADDPIHLLVVDDKPAIVEQIRAGLSGTSWKVTGAGQSDQALNLCLSEEVDVILASLALPNEGAYRLCQNLRGYAATAALPTFALSVKTALSDQEQAQALGFCGVITKPINCAELKARIFALQLETVHKYFQQRSGTLVLTIPGGEFQPDQAQEVRDNLGRQLTATVNAGGDKFIVDLTSLASAPRPVIELLLSAVRDCAELSLKHALVGSDAIRQECQSYEEAKSWLFASDFQQAVALLN